MIANFHQRRRIEGEGERVWWKSPVATTNQRTDSDQFTGRRHCLPFCFSCYVTFHMSAISLKWLKLSKQLEFKLGEGYVWCHGAKVFLLAPFWLYRFRWYRTSSDKLITRSTLFKSIINCSTVILKHSLCQEHGLNGMESLRFLGVCVLGGTSHINMSSAPYKSPVMMVVIKRADLPDCKRDKGSACVQSGWVVDLVVIGLYVETSVCLLCRSLCLYWY